MGLKICLDKNLDCLVAGVDFDANWCVTEIDLVSATIVSPDDDTFSNPLKDRRFFGDVAWWLYHSSATQPANALDPSDAGG